MEAKFKVGDLVALKTFSLYGHKIPVMVVTYLDVDSSTKSFNGYVRCIWFNFATNAYERSDFNQDILQAHIES